jgi:hypothetical protein
MGRGKRSERRKITIQNKKLRRILQSKEGLSLASRRPWVPSPALQK